MEFKIALACPRLSVLRGGTKEHPGMKKKVREELEEWRHKPSVPLTFIVTITITIIIYMISRWIIWSHRLTWTCCINRMQQMNGTCWL